MTADKAGESVAASGGGGLPGGEPSSRYRRLWMYSVFVTSFVAVVPLVIMTFVNYYQYQRKLEAEAIYPTYGLVSNAKRFMDDFLQERCAALAYAVSSETYEGLCNQEHLNRVFLNMKKSFGGFVDLGVIDLDGNQRSYAGRYKLAGKNYKEQDWFNEVYTKGAYVSDVFMGHRNSPHFVIAVRKDDGRKGTFCILRATIDMDVVNRYFASLDLRPSSDVFLINHKGILQTPSRHNGGVLDQCPIATPPYRSTTRIEEVTNREGETRILGYAYIDRSPFIFIVLKNHKGVMGNWLQLRRDMLWLLGVSILLVMGVILWSSTSMVSRIQEADQKRSKVFHEIEYTNKMASIGRMAAGVAHEINNPLAIINENVGLLKDLAYIKDRPLERERILRITETSLKSVERCSSITHRLLGFAKRMDPVIERIALGPLVEEVLSFQGKEAEYRGITIDLVVPEDLPTIESDRGQLQQVFLNILNNAFSAVDKGGRIDISLKLENGNTVVIRITDNGQGIPEEHINRIFEPFFSTKGERGTGLGLSVTFGIVEKLGGRISVESKVGEGASFIVRLPVARRG